MKYGAAYAANNFQLLQRMELGGVSGGGWLELGWTILLMQASAPFTQGWPPTKVARLPIAQTISIHLSHIFSAKQSLNFLKFCANAKNGKNLG